MNKKIFYVVAFILPLFITWLTKLTGSLIYLPAIAFLILSLLILIKRTEGSSFVYVLITIFSSILSIFSVTLLPRKSDMEGLGLIVLAISLIFLSLFSVLIVYIVKRFDK
ncbi:hypothetical protein FJZ22_01340 [Candidatus Pacearchaeota archaeon]|nr:hypothetical protein [Candidatus Pacearchaeota archaeon]